MDISLMINGQINVSLLSWTWRRIYTGEHLEVHALCKKGVVNG